MNINIITCNNNFGETFHQEYNYAILDIDRYKTVIVNAGRQAALKDEGTQSLGNSNLGKEAFERNQKKLQVQS